LYFAVLRAALRSWRLAVEWSANKYSPARPPSGWRGRTGHLCGLIVPDDINPRGTLGWTPVWEGGNPVPGKERPIGFCYSKVRIFAVRDQILKLTYGAGDGITWPSSTAVS
jgi:hypothetical protein